MIIYNANTSEGIVKIKVPENYSEVSYLSYCRFLKNNLDTDNPLLSTISAFTGIERELIEQMPAAIIKQIKAIISFIDHPLSFDVPKKYNSFELGNLAWKKLLAVETAISQIEQQFSDKDEEGNNDRRIVHLFELGIIMAKEFLEEDISDKPVSDWAWVTPFFLTRLKILRECFLN